MLKTIVVPINDTEGEHLDYFYFNVLKLHSHPTNLSDKKKNHMQQKCNSKTNLIKPH